MAKEATVAPKERINITYVPATGDAQEQVELPLKLLVIGDFTGRRDETLVEDRRPVRIDKDNFNEVLEGQLPTLSLSVPDKLSAEGEADREIGVHLTFRTLKDFEPEQVGAQVAPIRKLLELREALVALKGPLGNVPAFRRKIQDLLGDETSRQKLLDELSLLHGEKADDE